MNINETPKLVGNYNDKGSIYNHTPKSNDLYTRLVNMLDTNETITMAILLANLKSDDILEISHYVSGVPSRTSIIDKRELTERLRALVDTARDGVSSMLIAILFNARGLCVLIEYIDSNKIISHFNK